MGLCDIFKNVLCAAASVVGINYSRNDAKTPQPTSPNPAYQPRGTKGDTSIQKGKKNADSEPIRLMEKVDDEELAKEIVNNVYTFPFLREAGKVGRTAIKHVSAILTGGSVLRMDVRMKLYEGFKMSTAEGSSVPIEARVMQAEYITSKMIAQATSGRIKRPQAVRTIAGVLEIVRKAQADMRYSSDEDCSSLLDNLEGRLGTAEATVGSVPASERTPYNPNQLKEMNDAYNTVVNFVWFGKNDTKKAEQAKEALEVYKQLRSNSVAAFNDPVTTRLELETLKDLMKLKEKALAANKDIETGLYAKAVENEDIRKYAVVAQTLRKHATAMDAEIIKLEQLKDKITKDQKNRKKKVKAVRESIDRTMKDIGSTIYHSLENSKIGISAQTQEGDILYGNQKIEGIQKVVYEKAAPFVVSDLVLSPYDQLGKTQWFELAKKKMTIRAYTELAHGVNAKVQTKAVELTQKEVLRAYDMARTITDGIRATACVEARKTNIDDVLNHLLEKMLYQKLKASVGYQNGVNAFGAYTRAREAERQWHSTPVYNIFEMGKRNEARRTAEAEYKKAKSLAPEIGAYRRGAERMGGNRRAA